MHKLGALLAGWLDQAELSDIEVQSLSLDSRSIGPQAVFFAYPGGCFDGRDYLQQAVASGAVACVVESEGFNPTPGLTVPVIAVPQLAQKISLIAARFFDAPSHGCSVVGVTGTNGKTSCVQLLAQALTYQRQSVGVLTTIGNGVWPTLTASPLTTLDPIALQQQMALFRQANVGSMAMEVSSHALVQGRVNSVAFDVAVFTNLSHEHLDFHGDMASYAEAKFSLFAMKGLRYGVVNWDDRYGRALMERQKGVEWIAYSLSNDSIAYPCVRAKSVSLLADGLEFVVDTPLGSFPCRLPLLGRFNVQNVLAVVAVLLHLGLKLSDIEPAVSQLRTLPGRMEALGGGDQPLVVVDFAHTPDALQQALVSLQQHSQGRLICVFGCGGNRDKAKRAMMAQVAERYADEVIVTNDNPRHECPQAIAQSVFKGFTRAHDAHCILDRRAAIEFAVQSAQIGDIVLLAGKGHEEYQWMGDRRINHSDRKIALELVGGECHGAK